MLWGGGMPQGSELGHGGAGVGRFVFKSLQRGGVNGCAVTYIL